MTVLELFSSDKARLLEVKDLGRSCAERETEVTDLGFGGRPPRMAVDEGPRVCFFIVLNLDSQD